MRLITPSFVAVIPSLARFESQPLVVVQFPFCLLPQCSIVPQTDDVRRKLQSDQYHRSFLACSQMTGEEGTSNTIAASLSWIFGDEKGRHDMW